MRKVQRVALPRQTITSLLMGIFFALLILFLLPLAAVEPKLDLRFTNYNSESGLSSDWVRCIIQDHLGYLWVGTDVGLDRYDGYSFIHYRHQPSDPSSISQERIYRIRETLQGNLWLHSADGIDIFDPHSGRVLRHLAVAQFGVESEDKAEAHIDGIHYPARIKNIAAARDGGMWLGTDRATLFRMDGASGLVLPLPAPLLRVNGYSAFEDASGNVWIATKSGPQYGLVRYTPGSERLNRYPAGERPIILMNMDHGGHVWFASKSGLDCFDTNVGSFRYYPFAKRPGVSFLGTSYPCIVADRADRLWIGSEYGLRLFDLQTGHYMEPRSLRNSRGAPIFESIYDLCADTTSNIWLGTFTDGLFKYNERFNRFHFIGYNPDPRSGLLDPHVVSVMEDRQGIIWLTTWGGVLTRYDPSSGVFTHYQGAPFDPDNEIPKRLYCPFEDRSGNIWLGSTAGLVRFDKSSGRFHHFALMPEQPGGKAVNPGATTTIHEESPSGLIFSTMLKGLFHVNKIRHTYTVQPHQKLFPKGNKTENISSGAFPDRSGTLWLCTNNGLHSFDPRSGLVSHFIADPSRPGTLVGDWVYHVCEDRSGTLWVATRFGLNRMDRLHGTFKAYTERDGLRGRVVYWIIEDDDGFLWLSTNEGISRFDSRNEVFRNYGPNEGVPIGRGFSACRSLGGKLIFTGINGIVIFDPRQVIEINTHVPPLAITALRVNNRSILLHKVFSQRDQGKEPGRVVLQPTDKVLSVEFAALDFTSPEKNRYAFRMEGETSEWTDLGTQRQVTFSGLGVGKHFMHIKGSNNDGVWNEAGVRLQIVVLPHFWQTWWFRLLVLLALAGLALLVVHVRRRFLALRRIAEPPNLDEICAKHQISKRERELLRLVIQGKSNRDIENELFISIPTVKRHLANIFEKFSVNSRLQLINFLRVSSIDVVPGHRPQDK
jgi:ligand-binding sensor domain-containing protein/DNA-binding CsgD family transcriptional regulator